MKISSTIFSKSSGELRVEYFDVGEKDIVDESVHHVCGYCFFKDQFVVVYHQKRKEYTPPSGGREHGETIEQATIREVLEESNMRVLHHELIGHQEIYEPERVTIQTRSLCIVEPIGEFTSDPDGDISQIKLIDPKDYKEYFDWKEIGDHIMRRALDMKKNYYGQRL